MHFMHKYAIPAWTYITLYGSRERNVKFSTNVYYIHSSRGGIGKGASL